MDATQNLRTWAVIVVILLGLAPTIAAGGVIYVDANTPDNNDGSSWAKAYKYLQDALAVAQDGNDVWVAEGIYEPDANSAEPNGTGDRYATFQLIDGVAIYGGFAGYWAADPNERDIELYETILSGDINTPGNKSDNSYHIVTGSGTNATAILDGFTITAGNANVGAYPDPTSMGGGMYNDGGSPTVTNCTFTGNSAVYGGGGMGNKSSSSPTVTNCTFIGNSGRWGGGMCNFQNSPTVTNCTFSGNSCNRFGGGMYNTGSSLTMTNCRFIANSAGEVGGGMASSFHDGNITVTKCTFIGNTAVVRAGGMENNELHGTVTVRNCTFRGNSTDGTGGGMENSSHCYTNITVTNCLFSGNIADGGGGMRNYNNSSPTVTNCTFSGNSANSYGGGMENWGSCTPTMSNCIFWGNTAPTAPQIYNSSSTPTVTYSDIEGGWSGTGNIDNDPLFIDPNGLDGIPGTADDEEGYVHLRGYSPCINAGDPGGEYSGQVDIDNQPRVAYGRVDMGADEVFPAAGDYEPDGDVDFADFARICQNWLLGAQ